MNGRPLLKNGYIFISSIGHDFHRQATKSVDVVSSKRLASGGVVGVVSASPRQQSPSQMSVLERMKQTPSGGGSLERSRDGAPRRYEWGGVEWGRRGSVEGGREEEGDGGEELVARVRRGRRSGRGRKKRRKGRGEGEVEEVEEEVGSEDHHRQRLPLASSIARAVEDKVVMEEGHVTSSGNQVTSKEDASRVETGNRPDVDSHMTREGGQVTNDNSHVTSGNQSEKKARQPFEAPQETNQRGSPFNQRSNERKTRVDESDRGSKVMDKEDSVGVASVGGRLECDFESEPGSSIVGHVSSWGVGEGGEGGNMSLEMELEIALRENGGRGGEREGVEEREREGRSENAQTGGGRGEKGEWRGGGEGVERRGGKAGERGGGERGREKSGGGGRGGGRKGWKVGEGREEGRKEGRGGGGETSQHTSPFIMVGEGNGSKTGSPSTLKSSNTQEIESENPLKIDPRSPASPTSPPHTHSHRHYHTSPSHHSHQAHSDRRAEQRRKTGPRHTTRRGSPDCDGDYDVITRSEVRELTERRTRSNAVGAKEEEQRRREEEGRKEEERRRREEERRREEKREEERRKRDLIRYDGPPVRSQHPSEADQRVNDIRFVYTVYRVQYRAYSIQYVCIIYYANAWTYIQTCLIYVIWLDRVDENMRLVFSLDVFITPEEQVVRVRHVCVCACVRACMRVCVCVHVRVYVCRHVHVCGACA